MRGIGVGCGVCGREEVSAKDEEEESGGGEESRKKEMLGDNSS